MDPISGQPSTPGWYWVLPTGYGFAQAVKVVWDSPNGTATLIPQLLVQGYQPTPEDIWYGPLDTPTHPQFIEGPAPIATS